MKKNTNEENKKLLDEAFNKSLADMKKMHRKLIEAYCNEEE